MDQKEWWAPLVPTPPIIPLTSKPFPFNGRPRNSAISGAVYIGAVVKARPALDTIEGRLSAGDRNRTSQRRVFPRGTPFLFRVFLDPHLKPSLRGRAPEDGSFRFKKYQL